VIRSNEAEKAEIARTVAGEVIRLPEPDHSRPVRLLS